MTDAERQQLADQIAESLAGEIDEAMCHGWEPIDIEVRPGLCIMDLSRLRGSIKRVAALAVKAAFEKEK